jgi:chloramphenicol 3-O-phosphotransferase
MESGKIIMINGTSSSGKTSIVHALQELLEAPLIEAGIDNSSS